VIVPAIHRDLAERACRIGREFITTGPGGEIHCVRTSGSGWTQDYSVCGIDEGSLQLPGEYNLLNAGTAIALASTVGIAVQDSLIALADFPGVSRRMERIGTFNGVLLLSDYAHHPDEMKAAIQGLRQIPAGRIGVVFQPHLYSRTASMSEQMGEALALADWSLVLPIYPAREEPLPGVHCGLVVDAAARCGAICSSCDASELRERMDALEADVIVFMGAGTIDTLCRSIAGERE